MKKIWNSEKLRLLIVGVLVGVLFTTFSPLNLEVTPDTRSAINFALHGNLNSAYKLFTIGNNALSLSIGNHAYASGTLDYAWNGVNDNVAVTQGLSVLQSHGGGEFIFMTENYTFAGTVNLISNLKLTLIPGTKITLANNTNADMFRSTGQSNIIITGGTFDGNGTNQAATSSIINLYTTQNSTVTGVTVENAQHYGIAVSGGSSGIIIEDNFTSGNAHQNIHVSNTDNTTLNISRVVIRNNNSRACPYHGIEVDQYGTGVFSNIDIDGNMLFGNTLSGIHLATNGTNENLYNVTISNNIITSNGANGIWLSSAERVSVVNNSIYGNSGQGIRIDDAGVGNWNRFITITGNTIFGNLLNQIHSVASVGRDIVISSNTLTSTADNISGIYFATGTSGLNIENNQIASSVAGATNNGIRLDSGVTNWIISGNNVKTFNYNVNNAASSGIISSNYLSNGQTANLTSSGSSVNIRDNVGYVTENSGTFSISAGLWGVSVSHGLSTNATSVQLTLTTNTTSTVYSSNITSTAFSANLSALQGSTVTGYWRAVVGSGN